MNRAEFFFEDAFKLAISEIIKKIPENDLNWYILELSASGNLQQTSLKMNMLDFLRKIQSTNNGIKLSYYQLIELISALENIDECFIVGCKMENDKSIEEIIREKNNYEYIIDYYDSTYLNIFTTNLKYGVDILSLYLYGDF